MKRIITFIAVFCLVSSTCVRAAAPQIIEPPKERKINLSITIPTPPVTTLREMIVVEEKEVEYEVAQYIWNYLKDLGYNDYVCAGIIGNMMVECGGKTLDLQPAADSGTHYGICQWSKKYYPDVIGLSLDAQCDYLRDNIQCEINSFGNKYIKNFDYNDFIEINDEQKAALAFAKSYERCGAGSHEDRQECATDAYKYFVS